MAKKYIEIFDNGGATADRYTAVYFQDPQRGQPKLFGARGMCENPSSPQGIGMYVTAIPGLHLGRKSKFSDLPQPCQRIVLGDLTDFMFGEPDDLLGELATSGVGHTVHKGLDFDPLRSHEDANKLRAKLVAKGQTEKVVKGLSDRQCAAMMAAYGVLK